MKLNALSALFIVLLGVPRGGFAFSLKSGDILLQSTECYLCSLIEAEENSPYSHLGVVVVEPSGVSVLEAWQNVERVSLDDFLKTRKGGSRTLVLRPFAFESATTPIQARDLLAVFERDFDGKHYDGDFLWNNSDERGEKYYCSEFAAKFLDLFLPSPIPTKAMHYRIHRDEWIKYFRGNPPDGLPGISPGDFERSPLFDHVGWI